MAVQLKISFRQTAWRDVWRTSSTARNPIAKSESRGRNPENKRAAENSHSLSGTREKAETAELPMWTLPFMRRSIS